MFVALDPLKKTIKKYIKPDRVRTENAVFRLHCVFTASLLMTCSILLTTSQLIGEPIQCMSKNQEVLKAVNTFCWTTSTFTIKDAFGKAVGVSVPHEGIDKDTEGVGRDAIEKEKKFYTYYQWMCFILFFQGAMCYAPKVIWASCEGGLLQALTAGMNCFCTDEDRDKRKNFIIGYFNRYQRTHKGYALKYWGCELLCLVNVVGQMFLMDKIFGGDFFSYGALVLKYRGWPNEKGAFDPMHYVFPRVTKCTFYKYGDSGTLEKQDNLCVLAQNIFNEKVFLFLWFWYIILTCVLSLLVILRLVLIFVPSIRPRLLNARSSWQVTSAVEVVTQNTDVGDWWLLYMIARNVDPLIYSDFISGLASRIDGGNREKKDNLYPLIDKV